jgi:transposase-like protein
MIAGGMSIPAIAEELDVAPQTIYQWANSYYPAVLEKINSDRTEELIAAYLEVNEDGTYTHSVRDVCKAFGTSPVTLYRTLQRHDPPVPKRRSKDNPRHFSHPDKTQAIIDDYRAGYAVTHICQTHHISVNVLYQILASQNPPVPKRQYSWADPDHLTHALERISPGVVAIRRRQPGETPTRDMSPEQQAARATTATATITGQDTEE